MHAASEGAAGSWGVWRVLFWWTLLNAACWWQAPPPLRLLKPETEAGVFLADFYQEWASARNRLEGLPVYTPQEITIERYLGLQRDPNDPWFLEVNAHPPAAILLALPLARLSYADAFLVWNLLSLGVLALSIGLIVRALHAPWLVFPILTLLLVTHGFWWQLILGQLNLLLLGLLTAAWVLARQGRGRGAGVFLGVATALKLFPGFLFFHFLLRRQWRVLAAGAVTVVGVLLLTELLLGPGIHRTYVGDVLPQTSSFRASWRNLSLVGLGHKLFDPSHPAPGLQVVPLARSPLLAQAASLAGLAAMLAVLTWVVPRGQTRQDEDLAFGLAVIAMLLVCPIVWDHYFLLLLLPLPLLWLRLPRADWAWWAFCLALLILCLDPEPTMAHVLILLDAEYRAGVGWIATPLAAVTALAVHTYALLVLLGLGLVILRRPAGTQVRSTPA